MNLPPLLPIDRPPTWWTGVCRGST